MRSRYTTRSQSSRSNEKSRPMPAPDPQAERILEMFERLVDAVEGIRDSIEAQTQLSLLRAEKEGLIEMKDEDPSSSSSIDTQEEETGEDLDWMGKPRWLEPT